MKYRNHLMIFVITATVSFMAGAEEVYESRDKQGNVEFSDKSSPGAKAVEVGKPTIVHLEAGKPVKAAPAAKETKKPADPGEPETVYRHVVNDDEDENRRRRPREDQERREHREDQTDTGQQAVHGKEAARHGGRR